MSRFNPQLLVKRFAVSVIAAAMVLLGSATMASATTLATPAVASAGSGAAQVTFAADGIATTYTVVASPGGATCSVVGVVTAGVQASPSGSQSCDVTGLTNGTSYTFNVTPSGNSDTNTYPTTAAFIPRATLATPVATSAGEPSSGAFGAYISFTADGIGSTYTVTENNTTASTTGLTGCLISNSTTPPTGAQSCYVSNLVNTDVYTFTVTVSGNSDSNVTTSNSITAGAALAAPTVKAGSATSSGDTAVVTFVADGTDTTYTVTYGTSSTASSDVTAGCTVINTTTAPSGSQSCTVTGLTANATYYFVVTPSGVGTDLSTANISAVYTATNPLATPTAVTDGATQATVSFVADGVAQGYDVTIASGSGGTGCSVISTPTPPTGTQSCVVTGLTGGTPYTFKVAVKSGYVNGSTSTISAASSSLTALGAIVLVSEVPGNAQVTVSFTADGAATSYLVTAYSDSAGTVATGQTCTKVVAASTSGTQSCIVTGLTNGTGYYFTVTPSGGSTTSTVSAVSGKVTPSATAQLAAPTVAAGAATASGVTSAVVSFTADGIANGYDVTYGTSTTASSDVTAGCSVINTVTSPTGTQSCTVGSLADGTTYYFHVSVNSTYANSDTATQSPLSSAFAASTKLATPTVANAGSGAIKVSFVADGVAKGYTVTASSGGFHCTVSDTSAALTGAQSCTVSGLTNGVTYTFSVALTAGLTNNSFSTTSAASKSIEVGTAFLGTPTASYGGSGAALVAFTADGVGSTYTVTASAGTGATTDAGGETCTVVNSTTPPTGAKSCTVSGLANGDSYSFTVTPSGNGDTTLTSLASASFTAAAAVAPDAPTGVTATGGTKSIVVTWVAPANTGGSAITGYVVTAVAGNATFSCGTVAATATTCTISGLADATAYAVSVSAVNAIGTGTAATGSATTSAAAVTPPPVVAAGCFTSGAHGAALVGRTVTITISGGGFYGQPKITSTESGTRVGVSKDSGTSLTIRVTTPANARMGWHTLTLKLANGHSCRVNYDVK